MVTPEHCVTDTELFWYLKERIVLLDGDFLASIRLDEEQHREILAYWWVELALTLDLEDEATRIWCGEYCSPQKRYIF
ncbi:MAG: hypothetical protein AB1420_17770 [Bacillota bacterium]